jgi:hypothetical protein
LGVERRPSCRAKAFAKAEGGFLARSWFLFTKAGHQKKFGYRSRVSSLASSEKNRANRQKRVSKAMVQQTGAQFYYRFVEGIKQRIPVGPIKAAISANRELILLYWDIGRAIVDAQTDKGYTACPKVQAAVDRNTSPQRFVNCFLLGC